MNAKLIMTVKEMENHDAWLAARINGIGGSDAGVIAGMNRWKSPYQLWLEKTGQVEAEDISNNEYVYFGNVLEQVVADEFTKRTGKKVRKAGMMRNNDTPWLLANVDRLVIGEEAGLECKTANGFAAKDWEEDKVPDTYYLQCQHYMMATGCQTWYIACLVGGNHFVWKEIPRNEEDIAALYEAEKAFWEVNVKQHVMPDVDGSDSCTAALKTRFPGGIEEAKSLPEEASPLLTDLDNQEDAKKRLEASIKEIKNKLCLLIGDHEVAYAGDRKITWKTQAGRVTVDSKKLKTDYPDVYEDCKKQGNPTRVLRV